MRSGSSDSLHKKWFTSYWLAQVRVDTTSVCIANDVGLERVSIEKMWLDFPGACSHGKSKGVI